MNVSIESRELLREWGHKVETAQGADLIGQEDGVVLKIRPRTQQRVYAVLSRFLAEASQEAMGKTLVIVDRNKYRVRRG